MKLFTRFDKDIFGNVILPDKTFLFTVSPPEAGKFYRQAIVEIKAFSILKLKMQVRFRRITRMAAAADFLALFDPVTDPYAICQPGGFLAFFPSSVPAANKPVDQTNESAPRKNPNEDNPKGFIFAKDKSNNQRAAPE